MIVQVPQPCSRGLPVALFLWSACGLPPHCSYWCTRRGHWCWETFQRLYFKATRMKLVVKRPIPKAARMKLVVKRPIPKRPLEQDLKATGLKLIVKRPNFKRVREPITYDGSTYDGRKPVFFVSAPGRTVFALGDLHGDMTKTEKALMMAGLLSCDGSRTWTGGSSVLVQVGDILDKGDREIAILSLLQKLKEEAVVQGGAVLMINGNHETRNAAMRFKHTTRNGMRECKEFVAFCRTEHGGDIEAGLRAWHAVVDAVVVPTPTKDAATKTKSWKRGRSFEARQFLFGAGGPLAKVLGMNGVILKVNNWLFVHGGVLPEHVEYGLEKMNRMVADWMTGYCEADGSQAQNPLNITRDKKGVLWNRLYSEDKFDSQSDRESAYTKLKAVLNATGCKGMVVGHTAQKAGMNCGFNGLVWRIDVGMSRRVRLAQPQLLEITDDSVSVRRPPAAS